MEYAVCTLFENQYHFGVAALTNSLYQRGYRGPVFAGYRGELPPWTSAARVNPSIKWPGSKTLDVAEGLQIHFLPLETDYHLTNYKPDFMMILWNSIAKEASAMYYFDPDIVINASWSVFQDWVLCGVALCEDVNSPLAENHPRRVAWRQYFGQKGISLTFRDHIYANGGYIGLSRKDQDFLAIWKSIQEEMSPAIGGLNRSSLNGAHLPTEADGPFAPFGKTDQDALNASVEAWMGPVSFIGQEAMGTKSGEALMPHALGQPKPWNWEPISQMLAGQAPRLVDKAYWRSSEGALIGAHSPGLIKRRLLALKIASFIGRFYRRA